MNRLRNWLMEWLWISTLITDQYMTEGALETQGDAITDLYDEIADVIIDVERLDSKIVEVEDDALDGDDIYKQFDKLFSIVQEQQEAIEALKEKQDG